MRQFFYLLVMLNLLLFLWIYQAEQQLDHQQSGHPSIGDLQVVSYDAKQEVNSGDVTDTEAGRSHQVSGSNNNPDEGKRFQSFKQCTETGPVMTHAQAKILGAKLTLFNQVASTRSEEVASIDAYYEVILPPLNSNDAVTRKLLELQKSGVSGALRIRTGKYRNGISLGVYHYRDDAERRLLGARQFAENSVIIEREDESTPYWIETGRSIEKRLTADLAESIRFQFSGMQMRNTNCVNQD